MVVRQFNAPGLKLQAALIFSSLLFLVAILGIRAYSVARMHFHELSELSIHDLKAQGLLVRMETFSASRDQARRKFSITRDAEYASLAAHYDDALEEASRELRTALPPEDRNLGLERGVDGLKQLHSRLEARRNQKLAHAHEAARGLLKLILMALTLSGLITFWLFSLFYRGLLDPLSRLKEAVSRIRSGELSTRLKSDHGVAELRELSESFNLMAERLESLDSAKNEFLATISHEIKNPLAALKEGMNLLASQSEQMLPAARNRAFSACLIAAKRLESMINNLLHHSRMETGLFDFDLTPKDLSAAIHTAMEEVRPLAQRKCMNIEFKGDTELRAAFNWDGMVQVFENLLLNAIKYGDENTTIEVRARTTQRTLDEARSLRGEAAELPHFELAVINEGSRISENDLKQLFDRFYRGSNSKLQQGMGLGLHVVKRIIEAHHGGISAASESGKTRFQLWIPGRYETEAV